MASEITVTFSDGGIYNGYASSYTKDGQTTYYFEFDKKYRVQVLGQNILLQQYQNTNGSWYNIDIISNVTIAEIKTGGTGDVTLEYLQENYYSKSETDEKYVKKTGDTMTGTLYFSTNNSRSYINGTTLNFYNGEDTNDILLQLYAGNVFVTSKIYLSDHVAPGQMPDNFFSLSLDGMYRSANYTTPFNFNCPIAFNQRTDLLSWMYIRSSTDGSVTGIIQNNGNIAMYNGHGFYCTNSAYGGTGENWITLRNSQISGTPLTFTNQVVFQNTVTSYSSVNVNPSSGSGGNTVITAGNIIVYSSLNNTNSQRSEINGSGFFHRYDYSGTYMWLNYRYQRYVNSGQTKAEIADTGFDLYSGAGITYHSGAAATTEQYTRMNNSGITLYNTNGATFTINTNTNALTLQSLLGSGATAVRIDAPYGHYTLSESNGAVTGTGLYTACNNTFYSDSMLNALNQVLTQIMQNIGITYYVTFSGTSFSAGGGSSRGGGVGRRT